MPNVQFFLLAWLVLGVVSANAQTPASPGGQFPNKGSIAPKIAGQTKADKATRDAIDRAGRSVGKEVKVYPDDPTPTPKKKTPESSTGTVGSARSGERCDAAARLLKPKECEEAELTKR